MLKSVSSDNLDWGVADMGSTYPVLIINGNAKFAKTAHAPTGDEIENIPI